MVLRTHVRMLLASAGTTGDLDAQTDALLALLDADYVEHQLADLRPDPRDAGRCVGEPGPQAVWTVTDTNSVPKRWVLRACRRRRSAPSTRPRVPRRSHAHAAGNISAFNP